MEKSYTVGKRFLVVVQDLRISGTSEGVVSRSFIGRLRATYPHDTIHLLYLRNHNNDDHLELLPVDAIQDHFITPNIPKIVLWANKIYWRFFNVSLKDKYQLRKYKNHIRKINSTDYDLIFVRSSGHDFEILRSLKGLKILPKSIINFHDPYPLFWDPGSKKPLSKIDINKMWEMWKIITKARTCTSPSTLLSGDLEFLYRSDKVFLTLPHQFDPSVFPISQNPVREKEKKVSISYHGALQLSRNLEILIESYLGLLEEEEELKGSTEMVLRIRGEGVQKIKTKYSGNTNIKILKTLNFVDSFAEQKENADILIILESCSNRSNILVGKAPVLAYLQKPVLSLSPSRSEIRKLIVNEKFLACCCNSIEITNKLKRLIYDILDGKKNQKPFGDNFKDENFHMSLQKLVAINS